MEKKLSILHLEDNDKDADLIYAALEQGGIIAEFHRVQTKQEFVEALQDGTFDLVISDFSLPAFDGKTALELTKRIRPDIPFIFVSGTIGEDRAVDSLLQGATDYVLKDRLLRLVPAINRALERQQQKETSEKIQQELEKLSHAIRQSGDTVVITDRNGIIEFVNPAFQEVTGYSLEEAIGKTPRLLKSGRHSGSFYEEMWKKILAGGTFHGEFLNKRKNGELYYQDEIITPIVNNDGRVTNFVSTGRDVTQRKQAEEELRRSEERFRNLVENINDVIYTVDLNQRLTYISPVVKDLLGYYPDEVIGESIERFILKEDFPLVFQNIQRLLTGTIGPAEFRIIDKNGKIHWVRSSSRPISVDGKITGIQGVLTDQTERKLLEDQLRQSQKLESLGTLAGGVAHDINNILGIIMGHVDLLTQAKMDPEKSRKSIKAIDNALKRGTGVVRQLLTFARKGEAVLESVTLNDIVEEIHKLILQTFPKAIEIVVQLSPKSPHIRADNTQIHQVMLNLCVNARDAMPEGGTLFISTQIISKEEIQIRFPLAPSKNYAVIEVSDTGMGMDESTKSRIFEPFFTTKKSNKGTGLGLSTVFGIARSHNGYIDVESKPGEGTIFGVYFPLEERTPEILNNQKIRPSEPLGGNETILLVEDEPLLSEITEMALVSNGYKVFTAKDGLEAVETYQKHFADLHLVLTDIELPKISGEELVKRLIAIKSSTKIIITSGHLEVEMKERILTLGAKSFLSKPYDQVQILSIIRKVLDEGN
jgi:PAS domain S-box-containing protein